MAISRDVGFLSIWLTCVQNVRYTRDIAVCMRQSHEFLGFEGSY